MKIFNAEQIRKADQYTIENEPIASADLMERAAKQLFKWISNRYSADTPIIIFAGPGNNGGDGWALARLLAESGYWNIRVHLLDLLGKISPDSELNRRKLKEIKEVQINEMKSETDFPVITENDLVIDALFGSGLTRPLEGLPLKLVEFINHCDKLDVISVDIPSGLSSEPHIKKETPIAVRADHTLTFQFPKAGFFFAENSVYTGEWHVLPIGLHPEFIENETTDTYYLTDEDISLLFKSRKKFDHKGSYGHALVIAGSYGMMGAAVLAARAAVSSGAGLVTAHIPRLGYEIIQIAVPEALVSIDESDLIYTGGPDFMSYSAVAIGPGLKKKSNTKKALKELLEGCGRSLVIDADALNILSENPEFIDLIPENTILTPHPGEFDRLTQKHGSHYSRWRSQIGFSVTNKVIVVLKGAHTSITTPDGNTFFNITGNPGMATGGSGDVLTGMIVSLLAQDYDPVTASKIGVFLHGRAGDIAAGIVGQHAVTAGSIIENLGSAFKPFEL